MAIRVRVIGLVLVASTAACASAPRVVTDPARVLDRARAIHARVLTLDAHVDIEPEYFQPAQPNYATGLTSTQVDLPRMASGGLRAAFFSIYQEQQPDFTPQGYQRAFAIAMAKVEGVRRLTSELAPDRIGLALTVADIQRLQASGKLVALMGMENGYALGEDLATLRRFAALGVRYLSLAHNEHSQLSDSHTGEHEGYRWNGLSPLGRQVVAEANRLGVMLDISHVSKAASLETIRLSRAPVIASHSSARALADQSRNLDDEQLAAVGGKGGVVHVVAYGPFLKADGPERRAALGALAKEFGLPAAAGRSRTEAAVAALPPDRRAEYQRRAKEVDTRYPPVATATVGDLVDHIDYVVRRIGVDHVGIASDFDGGGGVDGWSSAAETLNVTAELVRRGYSERDIARIWSGNLMRVLERVERVAADLQRGGSE
jgi:membrane dipeptidase